MMDIRNSRLAQTAEAIERAAIGSQQREDFYVYLSTGTHDYHVYSY